MSSQLINLLLTATWDTIYMVGVSGLLSAVFGIPLGVILYITRKGKFYANPWINWPLGIVVNIGRSIPFIILILYIIPFTKLLVGTFIGNTAAIVPLTISAIPFVARMVEGVLVEVPGGLVEAAQSMGATPLQIIRKVLLAEATPGIINAMTITLIALIGYSAMAGAVGAGGLGKVAISYGYQRYNIEIMNYTVIILVLMVQGVQSLGDYLAKRFDHR
ncbi:ABC transporter permease [Suttonella sp. R2A3]|uniref:methionine ABC transporter permease n=1 Tax=Suttonella sp. R2A3 TaxID=2908648 RepID=UPI001F46DB23|nr:methionine ABC transporter permease [Suttonella sp. R2A3]UJF25069.1 ABC transporter permease [Suttonella sp. R2A3]